MDVPVMSLRVSRDDDTTELLQKQHDGMLAAHFHVVSLVVLICRADIRQAPKEVHVSRSRYINGGTGLREAVTRSCLADQICISRDNSRELLVFAIWSPLLTIGNIHSPHINLLAIRHVDFTREQ